MPSSDKQGEALAVVVLSAVAVIAVWMFFQGLHVIVWGLLTDPITLGFAALYAAVSVAALIRERR